MNEVELRAVMEKALADAREYRSAVEQLRSKESSYEGTRQLEYLSERTRLGHQWLQALKTYHEAYKELYL